MRLSAAIIPTKIESTIADPHGRELGLPELNRPIGTNTRFYMTYTNWTLLSKSKVQFLNGGVILERDVPIGHVLGAGIVAGRPVCDGFT